MKVAPSKQFSKRHWVNIRNTFAWPIKKVLVSLDSSHSLVPDVYYSYYTPQFPWLPHALGAKKGELWGSATMPISSWSVMQRYCEYWPKPWINMNTNTVYSTWISRKMHILCSYWLVIVVCYDLALFCITRIHNDRNHIIWIMFSFFSFFPED